MRLRTRSAMVPIIFILACGLGWYFRSSVSDFFQKKLGGGPDMGDAVAAQCFILSSSRETTFGLAPGSDRLRILTNANLPHPTAQAPDGRWRYGIRVTLRDIDRNLILEQDYHYVTNLTLYNDPETATLRPVSQYWDEPLQPLNSRKAIVKLDTLNRYPAYIGITLLSRDPDVRDVTARVFCRRSQSLHKRKFMWQRMRPETRELIVRSNVYSVPLVTDEEINSALALRWEQLPPEGVLNKDFERRVLYSRRLLGTREIDHDVAPEGVMVGPTLYATVPLPSTPGTIQASVRLLDAEEGTLNWHWYGKGIGNQQSGILTARDGRGSIELPVEGGLFELRSPVNAVLKLTWLGNSGQAPVDLTPKPIQARSFVSEKDKPISYAVRHPNGLPTQFRFRLRTLLTDAPVPDANRLLVQMITENGTISDERVVEIPPVRSFYDRALTDEGDRSLSEAVSCYFFLPKAITSLRLTSLGDPVLINGFNRPLGLVRNTQVPESYFHTDSATASARNWFPLRPVKRLQLEKDGRVMLMRARKRPPQPVNPDILLGNYTWQSYRPEGNWQARHIVIPKSRKEPEKVGLSPVEFAPVPTNTDTDVTFRAPDGNSTVKPTLIFLADKAVGRTVSVEIDGTMVVQREIFAARGEVPLPPVAVGNRKVKISIVPDAPCLLNHCGRADQLPFLKRFAFRLKKGMTSFTYEKAERGREMVMLRLYSSDHATPDSRLRCRVVVSGTGVAMRLASMGPFKSWTFINRNFDVLPMGGDRFPVLGTQTDTVDAGQPVFVPLNDDLPPGKYTIQLHVEESSASFYVVLSHTRPGQFEKRMIRLEDDSL